MRTNEIKDKLVEIKEWGEKIKWRDLKYETRNRNLIFSNMKRKDLLVIVFNINSKINIAEAEEDQNNLLNNIVEFNNKSRTKSKEGKDKKYILMKVHMLFKKVEN